MSAVIVIFAVRPKLGEKVNVRALFDRHVPTLRREGLITDRASLLVWSSNDEVFIESFEWTSIEHSRRAESSTDVQEISGQFAELADFVPLASLTEMAKTFAHFQPA